MLGWIKLGAGLAIVAALWFAWHELTGHYEQLGHDSRNAEVKELTDGLASSKAAERDREAETAACVETSRVQSNAIAAQAKRAQAARDEARVVIAKAQAESLSDRQRIEELQTIAARPPKPSTCEDTLRAADAIARETAMSRRRLP